jgi:hypothetical protein
LRQLRSIDHHSWQFIIALANHGSIFLSFDHFTDHEQIWLRVEEQPPERLMHIMPDPKMIVTITWNPLRFRLLDARPKKATRLMPSTTVFIFSQNFFRSAHRLMRGDSLFILTTQDLHTARKCQAFCDENRLRPAVHPPYSHDLVPTDFFLFEHIKHCLQGIAFPSREELLAQFMKSSGHPATNLGGRVSALDGETRMGFSE